MVFFLSLFLIRGFAAKDKQAFRRHYAQLADVRAMLPANVPLMALTATATKETRKSVINNLAMYNVHIVEESPNRDNIKLVNIAFPKKDYEYMFSWLIGELKSKRHEADRVIIYCRTLQQCRELYGLFFSELKSKKGDQLSFAMYHSESTSEVQQAVLQSFTKEDGNIRVLFSTIAFGMGVDVKRLHTIVHLGVPSDPASFLQESGRAGRDGEPSVSIILTYPGVYADGRVDTNMKEYIENKTVCRRALILKHFGHTAEVPQSHTNSCCDLCQSEGNDEGISTGTQFEAEDCMKKMSQAAPMDLTTLPRRTLNMDVICELNERLSILRLSQAEGGAHFLAGEDIVSGIPSQTINRIVAEAEIVFTFDQFRDRYAIYSDYTATWNILSETVASCPIQCVEEEHMKHTQADDDIDTLWCIGDCVPDQFDVDSDSEFHTAQSTAISDEEV